MDSKQERPHHYIKPDETLQVAVGCEHHAL
jgi:hypothetical protein